MCDEARNVLALLDVRGFGLHASDVRGVHRWQEACMFHVRISSIIVIIIIRKHRC